MGMKHRYVLCTIIQCALQVVIPWLSRRLAHAARECSVYAVWHSSESTSSANAAQRNALPDVPIQVGDIESGRSVREKQIDVCRPWDRVFIMVVIDLCAVSQVHHSSCWVAAGIVSITPRIRVVGSAALSPIKDSQICSLSICTTAIGYCCLGMRTVAKYWYSQASGRRLPTCLQYCTASR